MGKLLSNNTWCVYALKCRNNFIYVGSTNNLKKRLTLHNSGKGSKFVRTWRPFELVQVISCKDGKEARSLEYSIKQLRRDDKLRVLGIECEKVVRNYPLRGEVPDSEDISRALNKGIDDRPKKAF